MRHPHARLRYALPVALMLIVASCAVTETPDNPAPRITSTTRATTTALPTTIGTPTTTNSMTTTTDASRVTSFGVEQRTTFATTIQQLATTLPNPGATVMATVRRADGASWSGTASSNGQAQALDETNPHRPVRVASVGKTFTASSMFRLIEDGRLGFDDPIASRLTPSTINLLIADGYDPAVITMRHLLQHTSGVFDYAFGAGSPMLDRALNDPSHRWTRQEQLELAVSVGDPLGPPGQAFHYSDTNYILAGEIIEQITGRPYHAAMRDLLHYERLGLQATWMEYGEELPLARASIARSFFGDTEITALNFSIDAFGGGGLASTTDDLARFFEALFGGKVFEQPATLAMMTAIPDTNNNLSEFGVRLGNGASGIYRLDLDTLGACWGHRGFTGIVVVTCPTAKTTVAITTNTALTDPLPAAIEQLIMAARS
jgi:D-alanyl-D-alanine carboxypeptidase